jgi:hypothetical protein
VNLQQMAVALSAMFDHGTVSRSIESRVMQAAATSLVVLEKDQADQSNDRDPGNHIHHNNAIPKLAT